MYAVGRLGSYISHGVYTVSGPFHPFGGAVDIIVVEQPDGSFKSSPWYVRFGKFQGVLKTREKVVSISVNGIEANFHMFLDHKGEAYFLREADVEEGESDAVSFPFSSGDETDEPSSGNRRPMKSKSCSYDADKSNSVGEVDVRNGKLVARTCSRRSGIFGLVFGQRSTKEDDHQEGAGGTGVMRTDSLERAEIAANLLEVKWSTNLASNRSNDNASRFSSTNDTMENKGSEEEMKIIDEENQFRFSVHDKEEKINVRDKEENSVDCQTLQETTDFCNKQKVSCSPPGLENLECSVEEASVQLCCVSTKQQIVETSSLDEGFMEDKCKVIANISGTTDDHSVENSDHGENESGALSGMSPDLQSEYKLESCIDKQLDEELADKESNVVLPGCVNSNKENVSDSLQAIVYCETSELSVITLDGSSEKTHQTMCLSDVGNGTAHVHAETLLTTTELVPEVAVLKQSEEMELNSEGALTVSESYHEMVGVDLVVGLEEMKSNIVQITSTISDLGEQVEDEKNIEDVLHPSLESVDDSHNFCSDSDPKRSIPPSESSEDEQFLLSDLDELKLLELDCVNKDLHPAICTETEENGLCNVNDESCLNPDKFVQENPSTDLETSCEKARIVSNPISISTSRNHRVAGEKNGWQVESLPNMWSPIAKFDANNHRPLSHSLDSNSETMRWTPIKKDDLSCIRSDADEEQPLAHERSSYKETETSGKLKNTLYNAAVEISLCKHLLYEGMGAEAACQAFDAEKLDSKKFSSLGPAVVKNDRLVVRISGRYFPWDAAAPILLGMVTFGSEEIFEAKGLIPVDRAEKSIEGDPSKAVVSRSGSWRLWPFSLKRSRSRKAVLLASADTSGLDAENAVEGTVARDDKILLKPKQVKKMTRANTPTSEQLASLNLKDGMNHITFTFFTNMLGKQQVDARIYLWKWNTRIVISDVDGTITRSDVLGQFMPLVGIDWSQTGVAHLFSAIKENGYQLLFLSARAISQAYITRQFLVNLKQDGKTLPDGPIVISPDGLFPSLYREVIRRAPHEFKIACLEDIKALFPADCNPFYAGFGNRDTDEMSYLKVGIPKGKIFIINPKGEVAVNRRVDTKSYSSLHALVHGMFPPMAYTEQEDFNSWNFWKLPPPLINM